MKRFALALYALSFGFAAMAQDVGTNAASAARPLPEPLSATDSDNTRYRNDPKILADCQAQLDAINGKPCDVIFIGDSLTAGWLGTGKSIWNAKYEPLHALNFGVGGDKTQNVLWRLNNMSLQDLKPKVAVVMIGTNNYDNTPHEIAAGVKAVLATTQMVFSGVKIILVSITPNRRSPDKIADADKLLRGLADDASVYYLDLVPLMPAANTTGTDGKEIVNYKGVSSDGLHLDASGYQIWADAMDPLLQKALGK